MQTWEDCKQADVFHLLYDWLLVLLQERLLSSQDAQAGSVITAWHQMLWVAALAFLLLLTSGAKAVWITLRFFVCGELTDSVVSCGYQVQFFRIAFACPI